MSNEKHPILVVNARIATGWSRRPWAEAAVVEDDAIVFLGNGAEAAKRVPADARVVNAGGKELTQDEVLGLTRR
jgi:predicted amidohydrolase YtcJ